MAVTLKHWTAAAWPGETVPRPPAPPTPGAAPTPIYESLVREWSRYGRTVPGQSRGPDGAPPYRLRRTDDPSRPYVGAAQYADAGAYGDTAAYGDTGSCADTGAYGEDISYSDGTSYGGTTSYSDGTSYGGTTSYGSGLSYGGAAVAAPCAAEVPYAEPPDSGGPGHARPQARPRAPAQAHQAQAGAPAPGEELDPAVPLPSESHEAPSSEASEQPVWERVGLL